jgi:hypothetical protein
MAIGCQTEPMGRSVVLARTDFGRTAPSMSLGSGTLATRRAAPSGRRQTPLDTRDLGLARLRGHRAIRGHGDRDALQPHDSPLLRALRAPGKPRNVAFVACLHKLRMILNGVARDQFRWRAPVDT